jgi:hypothetical protein
LDASSPTVPAGAARPGPAFDPDRALLLACQTLEIEAQALLGLKARQGDSFAQAVHAMLGCRGKGRLAERDRLNVIACRDLWLRAVLDRHE